MNCLAVRDRLAEHVLGSLPPSDGAPVEEHLGWCAACRKEAGELQHAAATLAYSVAPVDPPFDLEERVVEVVRGAANKRRAAAPRRSRVAAAGVLAAMLALSGLGWGAVMAGRADRFADQAAAARIAQQHAIANFKKVVQELEGADPANILELADLSGGHTRTGAGQGLVLLSPSTDDFVLVVVTGLSGLRDDQLPLEVRLVSNDSGELVVGQIAALDSGGGATVSRGFVENLRAFDGVVVRDARGKVLLRGGLGVRDPSA